ncbi:hypothetical protein BZA77DRAFT_357036 [Pyronema omphalodes]|nr:hypothetical protein BZA77DRAFT_357036 [Pyronema omphalodes]
MANVQINHDWENDYAGTGESRENIEGNQINDDAPADVWNKWNYYQQQSVSGLWEAESYSLISPFDFQSASRDNCPQNPTLGPGFWGLHTVLYPGSQEYPGGDCGDGRMISDEIQHTLIGPTTEQRFTPANIIPPEIYPSVQQAGHFAMNRIDDISRTLAEDYRDCYQLLQSGRDDLDMTNFFLESQNQNFSNNPSYSEQHFNPATIIPPVIHPSIIQTGDFAMNRIKDTSTTVTEYHLDFSQHLQSGTDDLINNGSLESQSQNSSNSPSDLTTSSESLRNKLLNHSEL